MTIGLVVFFGVIFALFVLFDNMAVDIKRALTCKRYILLVCGTLLVKEIIIHRAVRQVKRIFFFIIKSEFNLRILWIKIRINNQWSLNV